MVKPAQSDNGTKVITNFGGRLTRLVNGDMNSGLAKYSSSFGADPFSVPGTLSWQEQAVQIDPAGAVVTGIMMAGKERVENGISFVYSIDHLARLYKIQVNDPSTYNPNYDNPVLLATLTINSPTFTRGGSIDFFGTSEKIYIGHDMGATSINFDGSGEAFVGVMGSWTQNVPRPSKQYVGNLYFGNGNNLTEVIPAGTVSTYAKFATGFPTNTQARDIDINIDGTYMEIVVSRLALPDITATAQDTTFLSNSESYIFKWNGSDVTYSAFDIFPSFSMNANTTFGASQYTFGYDLAGCAVFAPTEKILSPILSQAPLPNAVGSNGNLVGWCAPEFFNGFLKMAQFIYGSLDSEVLPGWWRQYQQTATGTETDILRVPFQLIVSNLVIGASSNGYQGNVAGVGKLYFSTLETSASPTTKYKLYRFNPVPTGFGLPVLGVYETQTQMFSKKVKVSQARIYLAPLVAGNSFQIDLIGSSGNPITNSTKVFTAGTGPDAVGNDYCWYNPTMTQTYALGVRITNLGTTNFRINKIELDYAEGGH